MKPKERPRPPSELSWQQKEKERRVREELELRHKQAAHGELGQLTPVFDQLLLPVLEHASSSGCPTMTHLKLQLSGRYMIREFIQELMQLTSKWAQIQINAFFKQEDGENALHYLANHKPARSRFMRRNSIASTTSSNYEPLPFVGNNSLILIGRNVQQWEESCDPTNKEIHRTLAWVDSQSKRSLQLFQPLDTAKVTNTAKWVPMTHCATLSTTFVPRQRVVYMEIQGLQVSSIFNC